MALNHFFQPCSTWVGFSSLLQNSPQATGAALPSCADSPWAFIISCPAPSGPWPMTEGCGKTDSQPSGLRGRSCLPAPLQEKDEAPFPGLPLKSPSCPASSFLCQVLLEVLPSYVPCIWILISWSASGDLSLRRCWLSLSGTQND